MRYARGTPEFNANMDAYVEMDEFVPMTRDERILLRYWVRDGHDIETNPWKIYEPDGTLMGFLKALRVHRGCSHGPWDSWEYADCIMPENPGFTVTRTKKR